MDLVIKIGKKQAYVIGGLSLCMGMGLLGYHTWKNSREDARLVEYDRGTKLDEEIAGLDERRVDENAADINKIRQYGSPEQLMQYYKSIEKTDGMAMQLAAIMKADGIDTSDIGEVRKTIDGFCMDYKIPSGPGMDEQILAASEKAVAQSTTIAAEQALTSTTPGKIFYIGANVYRDLTKESEWKNRMEERSKWDPWIGDYMRQTGGRPPSPGEVERVEKYGHQWMAIPEDRTPLQRSGDVVGIRRDGNTERRYIAPGATPEQMRQLRGDFAVRSSVEDYQRRMEANRNSGAQMRQDIGRATDAAINKAGQAAENFRNFIDNKAKGRKK